MEQIVCRRSAGEWPIKIGRRAHDDNPGKIRQALGRRTQEDLEDGIVLLGTGAVVAGAVGQEFRRVVKGTGQQPATVIDVRGSNIALDDPGGTSGRLILATRGHIVGAIGLGRRRIGQIGPAGKASGHLLKLSIDFKHLGTVDEAGVLPWGTRAHGEITGGIVLRQFSQINLVLQRHLNRISGEIGRAGGGSLGVDARDAGDEEIGLGEIEDGREGDRGEGGRSIDLGLARDQLADLIVLGAVDMRI